MNVPEYPSHFHTWGSLPGGQQTEAKTVGMPTGAAL